MGFQGAPIHTLPTERITGAKPRFWVAKTCSPASFSRITGEPRKCSMKTREANFLIDAACSLGLARKSWRVCVSAPGAEALVEQDADGRA